MINKTLLTSYILLLTSLYASPSWYYSLDDTKQNSYIGYGSASSEQEAKQNALVSISGQINTKIDSSLTTTKTKSSKDIQIKSSQKTKANISDYKLLKMSYEDGKYYIAIEYENIPNMQKFKNKLKEKALKPKFDNYLSEFELIRKEKRWYIKYKDVIQLLDKKDFARFFVTTPNENLTITTNKRNNILYDGDQFYFKIKSKEDGYISILTVYEDGTVSTMMKNIPIQRDTLSNIPDKDFEAIPEAGLLEVGVETYDMYVAVYSKTKLLFDRFATADDEVIEDERYKNFDELIRFIKNKQYTTIKIVTKPR
ncbi:MAG: LPP20 family lipoprotein [Campylobacterota bacterium]|nr:LPP20 family lipoprotein [Campylobacterota bacterium]